jgi:nucleoside-diphosphate-sugar epimerase
MFNNKTILVVGASGYIGSKLINELLNNDCTIIRLSRDKKKLKKLENQKAKVIDFEVDYQNINWSKIAKDVNIIYYLSSQTSVYIAEKDLIADYNSSVKPFVKLLKYCELKDKKITIVFASAATICGITDKIPIDESISDNPITIYDIHKLLIENYLKFYVSKNIVKGVSLRLANVYGPGIRSTNNDRGILNLMVRNALDGKNLTLYGDGEFLRDYIYIDDTIDAFFRASQYIYETNGNHYIISSGEQNTIKDAFTFIITQVSLKLDKLIEINYTDFPEDSSLIEKRNFIGNSRNFNLATGWKAKIPLGNGIKNTINYYINKDIKSPKY